MTVNWGIGAGNNALANFGYGVQLGHDLQDRRDQREQRNALIDIQRQQEQRLGAEQQAAAAQHQQEQRRADIPLLTKLLDHAQDEGTYQQARQIAQEYGIDVSGAPETYGDGAWVAQQRQVLHMMQTPQGQEALSTAGKQAVDAGFQPGTPEFTAAVRQIITAGMAKPYMGEGGETRLYTPDVFGGGGQVQGAQPFNPDEWEVVDQGGGVGDGTVGF